MAVGASITNLSTSPGSGVVAVGESFGLNFRLNNTGTVAIKLLALYLYHDGGFFETNPMVRPIFRIYLTDGAVVSPGKNRNYALNVLMVAPGGMGANRLGSAILYAEVVVSGEPHYLFQGPSLPIWALDKRYEPRVASLTVDRSPTEESTGVSANIKCSLKSGSDASYSGLSAKLQWKEEGAATFPSENTVDLNVANALSANGATVAPSFVFAQGSRYTFRATFTDGYDAAFSEALLPKSFMNLHLAGSGHGVAVGQYSTGTEESPKFECAYPAHFYGGIRQLDYSAERMDTGAKWIDGKAIYRKVIPLASMVAGAIQEVSVGESIIDKVVAISGGSYSDSNWRPIPYVNHSVTVNQILIAINSLSSNPVVRIRTGTGVQMDSGFVVIEYTL